MHCLDHCLPIIWIIQSHFQLQESTVLFSQDFYLDCFYTRRDSTLFSNHLASHKTTQQAKNPSMKDLPLPFYHPSTLLHWWQQWDSCP